MLRFGSLNNHKKPYQTVLLALLMGDMIVVVVVVGLDPELGPDLLPDVVDASKYAPSVSYTPWPWLR